MTHIVEIHNLTYRYPTAETETLKDLSLTIQKGQLCSVIGPNGAGKTTLCNVIRGFIPHFYQGDFQGDVRIDGTSIRDLTIGELALKVGFVFQNPFTQISGVAETVFEELAFGLENLGVPASEIRTRVEEVLTLTNIEFLRDRNPFELSGGQLQRVALASIIVMDPEILVIDEPTSQLDPAGTEEVFEVIKRLKEKEKTIILVEHKMELIAEYADQIVLLNDGKKVMEGRCEEILTDEEVLQHHTLLPQYACLGMEMRKEGMPLDKIPITEQEAYHEVSAFLERKRGEADG